MATYRQKHKQQQSIYSICMASKQCRERVERGRAHTLTRLNCLSIQFALFLLSALPLSCRLLVDQQGNALESVFIAAAVKHPLALLLLLPLFSLLVAIVVVYDLRIQLRLSWIALLDKRHLVLIVSSYPATRYHPQPAPVTFTQCVPLQVGQCRRGWPEGCLLGGGGCASAKFNRGRTAWSRVATLLRQDAVQQQQQR